MSETLTGGASGTNRADLQKKAEQIAAEYFGTTCVDVRLRDAESDTLTRSADGELARVTFQANFDAREHHDVEARAYGPNVCIRCDRKSWPQNPLPRADWSS